ncbi:MAG TPA: hypothetical protein VHA11_00230 [Bryobacteraceae bacterium]|nr:hypothetical protein [Bryobacteraceae bacterium]
MLQSVDEARQRIATGEPLLLAGSDWALSQLPRGEWVGGTIPYFMDVQGGICSETLVFVDRVPACAAEIEIRQYTAAGIFPGICADAPANGYSFLLIPGGSAVHAVYAQGAPGQEGVLATPVAGWVSGVHVSRVGLERPKVFNGRTGESSSEWAVVMHVALPSGKMACLDVVNVFKPGQGDVIRFPASGFSAIDCTINGRPASFPRYLLEAKPDPCVPLTAWHNGAVINVGLQGFDEITGAIHFYAPVFAGTEYRFAEPVPDYVAAFDAAMESHRAPAVFSCNCILNYLYAKLEGKRTGAITGPITYGEIAGRLLNQTLVRLLVNEASVAA